VYLFPEAINSTQLLVEIVNNCRHLAEVDSGTYTTREEEVDLRQLTESCLGLFGREREAGLMFDLHCPAGLTIVSDRLLWRHVLLNLVGNAVKFTMHGRSNGAQPLAMGLVDAPRVTILIERVGTRSVCLKVLDNGPGVDIGDQERIFSKFAQASRGFKAQGLGSGLGLHLSAKTIQTLRGELKLTSPLQPTGCGSSFGTCTRGAMKRNNARAAELTHSFLLPCLVVRAQSLWFRANSLRALPTSLSSWMCRAAPSRPQLSCGSSSWRTTS
jgi:signal transduction histidine kinase